MRGVQVGDPTMNSEHANNAARYQDESEYDSLDEKALAYERELADQGSSPQVLKSSAHNVEEEEQKPSVRGFKVMNLAEVEEREVMWLIPNELPLGKLVYLQGEGGIGKSLLCANWAARISNGEGLGPQLEAGRVLYLEAEDSPAEVSKPRLRVAGADLHNVAILDDRETTELVTFPGGIAKLAATIEREKFRFVVVNPVFSFLDSECDSHKDQELRGAFGPLTAIADKLQCTIVLVAHMNKAANANAANRGSGSKAILNMSRLGYQLGKHPTDSEQVVLAAIKCNLGRIASRAFRIVPAFRFPVIDWIGEVDLTADNLVSMAVHAKLPRKLDQAEAFVKTTLGAGPVLAQTLTELARKAKIAPSTLSRAKNFLGVELITKDGARFNALPSEPAISSSSSGDEEHDEELRATSCSSSSSGDEKLRDEEEHRPLQ
jgi:hypothetical protein